MSLLLPTRWQKQPQTPVEIDWSHPLAKGLRGLWIFNTRNPVNLVTGEKSVGTVSNFGVNKNGRGANQTSTTNLQLASNFSSLVNGANGSLLMLRDGTETTGVQKYFLSANSGSTYFGIYGRNSNPPSANSYYFNARTTNWFPSNTGYSVVGNKNILYTFSSSSQKYYLNGILGETTTGGTSASITSPFVLGASDGLSANFQSLVNVVAIWNRQLSDKEAAEASRNIYQVLRPQRRTWIALLDTSGDISLPLPTLDLEFNGLQLGLGDVTGNFALDLPTLDINANGLVGSIGDIALNYNLDLFLDGGAFVIGNISMPLPRLDLALTGLIGVREPFDLPLPFVDIDLVGEVGVYGDINLDLPVFDVSLERAPDIALDLPALDINFNGFTGVAGNINLPLPELDINFNGMADSLAGFDLSLLLDIQFNGLVGVSGNVDLDIPAIDMSMTGLTGTAGNIHLTISELDLSMTGGASVLANVDLMIPALLLEFYGNNQSTPASRFYNRWTR